MNLWHGSRESDSNKITDSDEGFDMRFASDGMHGVGNYFALRAIYSASDMFAHKEAN